MALAIMAALALGYALSSVRATYLALIESPIAPEQAGLLPMLAASAGAISVVLAREALSRQPHPLTRLVARAFGYSWIVGVVATIAITVVRLLPESRAFNVGEVVLGVFNYAIVGLLVSLPGLIALSVTRPSRVPDSSARTPPKPSP